MHDRGSDIVERDQAQSLRLERESPTHDPVFTEPDSSPHVLPPSQTNLNTFFLDQPVGVGLSFAESGQEVARTEQAALDLQAFVAIFFEKFKEFRGRRFHLSGESYGGRVRSFHLRTAVIQEKLGLT